MVVPDLPVRRSRRHKVEEPATFHGAWCKQHFGAGEVYWCTGAGITAGEDSPTGWHSTFWQSTNRQQSFWQHNILALRHFGTPTFCHPDILALYKKQTFCHPDILPPRLFATPDFLPPRHFTTQTFCHPDFFPHQIFLHIKRGRAKPDRVGPCVELKKLKKLKNKPEVTRWGKKKSTKSTKFLWSVFLFFYCQQCGYCTLMQ